MILVYEFIYLSTNNVLENLLENIAEDANIEHFISKNGDKISFHARGKEDEIGEFSKKLSTELPYSLFLKSVTAYASEDWDIKSSCKTEACAVHIPFTKKAADLAKKEQNPFILNEIGQTPNIYPPLILELNEERQKYNDNFGEAFEKAADIIVSGQKLNVKTISGTFCVSLIENKPYADFMVMPTDLSVTDKIAVVKNEEINALVSLEKPIIKSHTNMIFATKYPLFPRFIKLALANDLFLYLLSNALFKKGVEFVVLELKDNLANASLYFEQQAQLLKRIEVCALKEGQNVVVSGTSHIKPEVLKNIKTLKNRHHMQFAAFMQELKLFNSANCGIYLSLEHNDKIMFYNDKIGVLDLLDINYENSVEKIFAKIENDDENGAKLVANFRVSFPEILQNIKDISFENEPKNISNLWAIAALFLGFGENLSTAKQKIFENIEIFSGDKGPKVDYEVMDKESVRSTLNAYKFFKSIMSFRLAGAEDELLSYGVAESLAHFLNDFCDKLKGDFETENIIFMGSLFGFKNISSFCFKNISVNHKVHFGKELPLEI